MVVMIVSYYSCIADKFNLERLVSAFLVIYVASTITDVPYLTTLDNIQGYTLPILTNQIF